MKIIIETLQDEEFDVWKTEVEIEDVEKYAKAKTEGFAKYFNEKGLDVRITEVKQRIQKCTL